MSTLTRLDEAAAASEEDNQGLQPAFQVIEYLLDGRPAAASQLCDPELGPRCSLLDVLLRRLRAKVFDGNKLCGVCRRALVAGTRV